MSVWQLQAAKANFSELVKRAQREGPQAITVHGKPVAVVLSQTEFEELSGNTESLASFIRRSPLYGLDELDLARDQSTTRPSEAMF
jgi:prevent-host-death family protein